MRTIEVRCIDTASPVTVINYNRLAPPLHELVEDYAKMRETSEWQARLTLIQMSKKARYEAAEKIAEWKEAGNG